MQVVSKAWERRQLAGARRFGSRECPMSLLALGLFERDAQEWYAGLLQNRPLPVSKMVLNTTFRPLGFRLVAGISGTVHFYITRPRRNASVCSSTPTKKLVQRFL